MALYNIDPVSFGGKSFTTTSLGVNDPQLGQILRDGGKEYVWVYNNGGASGSVGTGVIISAISGYSVTVSSVTDLNGWLIGVVENNTLTTGAYAWVVMRGFTQINMGANNSAAAGERLVMGTDGVFSRLVSSNTDALRNSVVGFAVSAIASGASGTAYIRSFY